MQKGGINRCPPFAFASLRLGQPLAQDLHLFPAAGVVDKRYAEPLRGCPADGKQDVWRVVRGGDEVDVVAALYLEGEHHGCQAIDADGRALATLADLSVDAENTAKRAVRQEDRSRAPATDKAGLLAEMGQAVGCW